MLEPSVYPPLGCENNLPVNNTFPFLNETTEPFLCYNTTKCENDLNETAIQVLQGLADSGPRQG